MSIGFALLLPADVPRGRPGPVGADVPRAALTRLRKAGSKSLAAASFSLHTEALNYPLYTCNDVSDLSICIPTGLRGRPACLSGALVRSLGCQWDKQRSSDYQDGACWFSRHYDC